MAVPPTGSSHEADKTEINSNPASELATSRPRNETRTRLAEYEVTVRSGNTQPGVRLAEALRHEDDFITALLRIKQPLIFAESSFAGH